MGSIWQGTTRNNWAQKIIARKIKGINIKEIRVILEIREMWEVGIWSWFFSPYSTNKTEIFEKERLI